MARRPGWRATTAFDLWFCVRAAAGPRGVRSPYALSEASPSDRLAACRQGFPRCTRDTSTQTLKILGSWMYALAYVNCDSFSFPFLVGGRAAGRCTLRARRRVASISSDDNLANDTHNDCARVTDSLGDGLWCCATPRYVQ